MVEKSLELLVGENFVYAKVLDYFGIEYYNAKHKTLTEVCEENNIDPDSFLNVLEKASRKTPDYEEFRKYPVRLIVEYLKHAHQVYVKDTLPYLLRKIDALGANQRHDFVADLKIVMPMFVEDFIHHIYEEEDRLFVYVNKLEEIVNEKISSPKLLEKFDGFSIQEFALHHEDSDNQMKGIRGITNQYSTEDILDPQLGVILKALKKFDEELVHHANIENDILFPRALSLEKKARQMLSKNFGLN